MALLSRIYFNAVFGALGGLLGWMLFGIFGERTPSTDTVFLFLTKADVNALLGGAIIGGVIGYFVVSVEAIRDRSLVRFARLASYGVILAAIGGSIGMLIGDKVSIGLRNMLGVGTGELLNLIILILARALGWSLLGIAIGMSEGIAARSLGKFSYGTLGGFIGGFVGGALFEIFYYVGRKTGSASYFWQALGLIILGACIGSLSALVQRLFQPANVKVLRGWQEGREYPLEKQANILGRAEHADIALFRDMKVEKKHAYIKQVDGKYIFFNNGAPPENTLINDTRVSQPCELNDGDRIQLGNILMRFQLRAAVNRAKPKRALPAPTSGT